MEELENALSGFDLEKLDTEEKIFLDNALKEIEKVVTDKKSEILKSISDKQNLKKFI